MSNRFEQWKKVAHKDRQENSRLAQPQDPSKKTNGVTSAHSAATTNEDLANMQADEEKKEVPEAGDPLDHENYTDI